MSDAVGDQPGPTMELMTPAVGTSFAPRQRSHVRRSPQLHLRELVVHACYSWRVILVAAMIPLICGVILAATAVRHYASDATLIVLLGRDNTSTSDVTGSTPINLSITGLKEVMSEVDIVMSDEVIDEALQVVGPEVLRPGLGEPSLFGLIRGVPADEQVKASEDWFRTKLVVAVQDGTNILHLVFSHEDQSVSVRALEAVVDAYLNHRRHVFSNQTSGYLSTELDTTTKRLHEVDSEIAAVKAQYNIVDIVEDVTAAGSRIQRIQRRRDELMEQREGAQARVAAATTQLASLPEKVFASVDVSNATTNDDSGNATLRMQIERDHLAAQYAPNYPPLAELDQKLRSARAATEQARRTNSTATHMVRNPIWDTVHTAQVAAQVEAAALDQQLAEVAAELAPAEARVRELRTAETILRTRQRDRDVLDTNFRQFSGRVAAARINEDAALSRDANVHVVQKPTPRWRGTSQRLNFLAAGLFGALLMSGATAVLVSQMRSTFLLAAEAERGLGLPVLADLPLSATEGQSQQGNRHIANLAAMLIDIARQDRPNAARGSVIQFISTEANGPATVQLRALAADFAVIHNINTLLVDLHDDGSHHISALGGPTTRPIAAQSGALAVSPTMFPRLFVALNAAESDLASSRSLLAQSVRIMDGLRAQYGMVLINASSPVGDYAVRRLSNVVDHNVVVIEADRTRTADAEQLCQSLEDAGADVIGTVIVGVRSYVPRFILRWL